MHHAENAGFLITGSYRWKVSICNQVVSETMTYAYATGDPMGAEIQRIKFFH